MTSRGSLCVDSLRQFQLTITVVTRLVYLGGCMIVAASTSVTIPIAVTIVYIGLVASVVIGARKTTLKVKVYVGLKL